MWWFLITGKFLSLLSYSLLIKYYCYLLDLYDSIVGWYCFNFIYKSYTISIGKFFLISKEFRIFIKNLLIIYINIFIWPLVITFFEFCLIAIILSYFIHSLLTYLKYEKTKFSLTIIIFNFYIGLLFFLKTFEIFNLLDFHCITVIFIISCFIIGGVYYIFLNSSILYTYLFRYKIKQNKLFKFYTIKLVSYIFLFTILINLTLILLNKTSNNVIQEFSINFLIIYSYLYYQI